MAAARTASYPSGDQRRRAMIGKVKIAQKELGIEDGDYRAILGRLTGQASAARCTEAQLGLVLDEFKAKGWAPKISGKRPGPRPADTPLARKARALWISLHQLGVVHNRTEAALEAFVRRQLGVEKLQWADQGQSYKLVEALKAMAERAGWSQSGSLDDVKERLRLLLEARQ